MVIKSGECALTAYFAKKYTHSGLTISRQIDSEPFVSNWRRYRAKVLRQRSLKAIYPFFIGLQIPLQESELDAKRLRDLVRSRRAAYPSAELQGLKLSSDNQCSVRLYSGVAGKLPVIVAEERQDFEALLCALRHRSVKKVIPPTMGAALISGLINLERHDKFSRQPEVAPISKAEKVAFQNDRSRAKPFEDIVAVVSTGDYSGIPAEDVEVHRELWCEKSLTIRIAHEATHYACLRVFGYVNTHLHDEMLADYGGLTAAFGRYDARMALAFLGINEHGEFTAKGRLANYIALPERSQSEIDFIISRLTAAAEALQSFSNRVRSRADAKSMLLGELIAIGCSSLQELGGHAGADQLWMLFSEFSEKTQIMSRTDLRL